MLNVTWSRDTAAHLLRRAGFGATPLSWTNTRRSDSTPRSASSSTTKQPRTPPSTPSSPVRLRLHAFRDVQSYWLLRLVNTARPLEEKMVFFWHDHFATSAAKVPPEYMKVQNELFRTFALGNFKDMLIAVSKDPAMLDWLDNRLNRVGRPNENYGREVMELFTLREGNYTETDVQEVSRCFTGWTIRNDAYLFQPGSHDNGSKSFLGVNLPPNLGETDGIRVCETLAAHPACAQLIATKLFEFFAYPNPSQNLIDKYAEVYTESGYNIREVMRTLLTSEEFYSEKAMFGIKARPSSSSARSSRSLPHRLPPSAPTITVQGQTLLVRPTSTAGTAASRGSTRRRCCSARTSAMRMMTDRTDDSAATT
jgi:uncharacterized protein (DUF1800 family)